ncbi:MAG: hypothetical protein E6H04_04710, partial [Bacillati bacterium ANGP1]
MPHESPERGEGGAIGPVERVQERPVPDRQDRARQVLFLELDGPAVDFERGVQKGAGHGLTQRLRGHLVIGRDLPEVLHERLHALSQGRVVSLDVPAEIERTGERQRIAFELPQVLELEELFVD